MVVYPWIPAYAGMTDDLSEMTGDLVGMTNDLSEMTGDLVGMTNDLSEMTGDLVGMTNDLSEDDLQKLTNQILDSRKW